MINLMEYLPYFYQDSEVVKEIQGALSLVANKVAQDSLDTLNQFFIDTVDEKGLSYWENMLYISNNTLDIEQRKLNILSRLRGRETTTEEVIKRTVKDYTGLECIFEPHYNQYLFKIIFSGTTGKPNNFELLVKQIEKIKPAHLEVEYVFSSRTHGDLRQFTHDTLSKNIHSDIKDGSLAKRDLILAHSKLIKNNLIKTLDNIWG